ncbi:hypothetical protein D9757_004507 [Collybiopsis confluens]|uniref:RRM domain-containing protein n=1 Tax=Collybiopsis confluens TaxID=2823264 RepID=A0A8H5HXB8_9AGAR|nr:hypothetical protein D9757_004507 [Collybiopsis confluens]
MSQLRYKTVFLGGLPECEKQEIVNLLGGAGTVVSTRLRDGYAFIDFLDKKDAQSCIERLDKSTFKGKEIKAEFSRRQSKTLQIPANVLERLGHALNADLQIMSREIVLIVLSHGMSKATRRQNTPDLNTTLETLRAARNDNTISQCQRIYDEKALIRTMKAENPSHLYLSQRLINATFSNSMMITKATIMTSFNFEAVVPLATETTDMKGRISTLTIARLALFEAGALLHTGSFIFEMINVVATMALVLAVVIVADTPLVHVVRLPPVESRVRGRCITPPIILKRGYRFLDLVLQLLLVFRVVHLSIVGKTRAY